MEDDYMVAQECDEFGRPATDNKRESDQPAPKETSTPLDKKKTPHFFDNVSSRNPDYFETLQCDEFGRPLPSTHIEKRDQAVAPHPLVENNAPHPLYEIVKPRPADEDYHEAVECDEFGRPLPSTHVEKRDPGVALHPLDEKKAPYPLYEIVKPRPADEDYYEAVECDEFGRPLPSSHVEKRDQAVALHPLDEKKAPYPLYEIVKPRPAGEDYYEAVECDEFGRPLPSHVEKRDQAVALHPLDEKKAPYPLYEIIKPRPADEDHHETVECDEFGRPISLKNGRSATPYPLDRKPTPPPIDEKPKPEVVDDEPTRHYECFEVECDECERAISSTEESEDETLPYQSMPRFESEKPTPFWDYFETETEASDDYDIPITNLRGFFRPAAATRPEVVPVNEQEAVPVNKQETIPPLDQQPEHQLGYINFNLCKAEENDVFGLYLRFSNDGCVDNSASSSECATMVALSITVLKDSISVTCKTPDATVNCASGSTTIVSYGTASANSSATTVKPAKKKQGSCAIRRNPSNESNSPASRPKRKSRHMYWLCTSNRSSAEDACRSPTPQQPLARSGTTSELDSKAVFSELIAAPNAPLRSGGSHRDENNLRHQTCLVGKDTSSDTGLAKDQSPTAVNIQTTVSTFRELINLFTECKCSPVVKKEESSENAYVSSERAKEQRQPEPYRCGTPGTSTNVVMPADGENELPENKPNDNGSCANAFPNLDVNEKRARGGYCPPCKGNSNTANHPMSINPSSQYLSVRTQSPSSSDEDNFRSVVEEWCQVQAYYPVMIDLPNGWVLVKKYPLTTQDQM